MNRASVPSTTRSWCLASERYHVVMTDEMTCGKGLAEHAILPATLSKLTDAMAGVLRAHLHSLGDDAKSQPEQQAYTALVEDYRAVSNHLQRIAGRMASYRDLPMATHDEERLTSADATESLALFVQAERAVLEFLQSSLEQNERMLAGMGHA